jgi:DNA polymerase-3 subunit epsilon
MGLLRWLRRSRPSREPDWLDRPVDEVSLLALDLETTGLDPDHDHIVSLGWVPIERREVVLAGAVHLLVRPPGPIGESATIHGLTDSAVADAPPLDDVLPGLRDALADRVMVAHHAPLELGFLADAAPDLAPPYVDTLAVEKKLLGDRELPPGTLRLGTSRSRHGLPSYAAHSALTDALAAAELLLAQVAELEHRLHRTPTLRDLGAALPR